MPVFITSSAGSSFLFFMDPLRNDIADVINGIAEKIRLRLKDHPETRFNPDLVGENTASFFETLSKQIRLGRE